MADAEQVPNLVPIMENGFRHDHPLSAEGSAAMAVFVLRLCNPGITEADAVEQLKDHFQRISTQDSARKEHDHPSDATSADNRPTAAAPSETPAATAPPTDPQHTAAAHSQTPSATAPPTAAQPSPPPSGAADIFSNVLRSFSEEERSRRLIKAAELGAVDELRALIAAGTDVGVKARLNRTALHWAAINGHLEAARCLVEAGAQLNDKDNTLQTPLHYAAFGGHTAVVRLLAASGADLDATSIRRETPLHWAASLGHAETAAALLEAGASKEVKAHLGRTPLDLARQKNQQKLIELLS